MQGCHCGLLSCVSEQAETRPLEQRNSKLFIACCSLSKWDWFPVRLCRLRRQCWHSATEACHGMSQLGTVGLASCTHVQAEMTALAQRNGGSVGSAGSLRNVLMQMRTNSNHPDLIIAPFSSELIPQGILCLGKPAVATATPTIQPTNRCNQPTTATN